MGLITSVTYYANEVHLHIECVKLSQHTVILMELEQLDTLLSIFYYALLTVDMAFCQKGTSPAEATSNSEKISST